MLGRASLGVLAVMCMAQQAAAEDAQMCKPTLAAVLDMVRQPDGTPAVMLGLNGKPHLMRLGTANTYSSLYSSYANSADLMLLDHKGADIATAHGAVTKDTVLDEITFGMAAANRVRMSIEPDSPGEHGEVAGTVGANLLANFGVEVDFAANKVKLFAGCTNIGGYWAGSYAELPLDFKTLGIPSTTWQLNGEPVSVTFSIAAPASMMSFNVAAQKFALSPDSPGVAAVAGSDPAQFEYRFKLLTADGVTIKNPLVRLYGTPTDSNCATQTKFQNGFQVAHGLQINSSRYVCTKTSDLTLGLGELSKLHLFFDFPNKKLYFTGADAH
jgi:hypothetical protein